jgi:hypothetical protein
MTSSHPKTVTVSLDDPICRDSPSSSWTETSSETSSIMSGRSDKYDQKSPKHRVHFSPNFSPGCDKTPKPSRGNGGGGESSGESRRDPATPRPAAASTQNSGQHVPGVAPFNNFAPIPTAGQQVFVHHTGTGFNQPYQYPTHPVQTFHPGFPQPQTFITSTTAAPPVAMSGYVQPPNTGVHFQPQVPDTTNGPYVHTYHPRHDQGPAYYVQQPYPVGANLCLQTPPILQQRPAVIYQTQVPTQIPVQIPVQAATVSHCTHVCYASVASSSMCLPP